MAERAYRFVCESMSHGDRLAHSRLGERSVFPGTAGRLRRDDRQRRSLLNETTGQAHYVHDACQLGRIALIAGTMTRSTAAISSPPAMPPTFAFACARATTIAVPNPNAAASRRASSALWHLTGEDRYRNRADRLFRAYRGRDRRQSARPCRAPRSPRSPPLGNADRRGRRRRRSRAGPPSHRPRKPYRTRDRFVVELASGASLPPSHPANAKRPVDGRPAAYVCVGETCSLPVTDANGLRSFTRSEIGQS